VSVCIIARWAISLRLLFDETALRSLNLLSFQFSSQPSCGSRRFLDIKLFFGTHNFGQSALAWSYGNLCTHLARDFVSAVR
jgi:hypothetical protein